MKVIVKLNALLVSAIHVHTLETVPPPLPLPLFFSLPSHPLSCFFLVCFVWFHCLSYCQKLILNNLLLKVV
jgi:hypothetical protein